MMVELTRKQFDRLSASYKTIMIPLSYASVIYVGSIQGKLIETILCLLSFLILKKLSKHRLESASMVQCLIYSTLVFACLSRLALPIQISLICGPVIGTMLAYSTSKIASIKFDYESLKIDFLKLKSPKPFKLREATIDETIEQCIIKNITPEDREFVLDYYKRGIRPKTMEINDASGTRDSGYFAGKAYKLKIRLEK